MTYIHISNVGRERCENVTKLSSMEWVIVEVELENLTIDSSVLGTKR